MKSPHEPFDDELKERLLQYTEEPNENLWQGIVSQISSVNPEPNWVGWSQRISGAVVVGVTMIVGVLFGVEKIDADMFVSSLHQLENQNSVKPEKNDKQQSKNGKTLSDNSGNSSGNRSDAEIIYSNPSEASQKEQPIRVTSERSVSQITNETTNESTHLEVISENVDNPLSVDQKNNLKNVSEVSLMMSDTSKIISQQEVKPDTLTAVKKQSKISKKKSHRTKKYTLYFTAMPTFGYQRVEPNQTDNIIIESINRIPAFSTDRLGVRAELGAEFLFSKNKKFKMFGGVLYYQRKQTIGYTEKQLDSALVSSGPNGEVIIEPQFSYIEKSIEYELKNIGVQLGFNYRLSRNKPVPLDSKKALSSKTIPFPASKLLHMIGTGIEFQKSLNKTNEFDKANGFSNPSAYVFFNFYYRLQYPSEGRLRAIFQPTLNYSFYINENLNAPFYVKPYGLGLNFGCSYNF